MGLGATLYGAVLLVLMKLPERISPQGSAIALLPGLLALGGTWWLFRSLTGDRIRALPNRHQGRKERGTELTVRARTLLSRIAMAGALAEIPAMIGIALRIFGAPLVDSVAFIAASILALGWLWLRLPRTLEDALA